VHHGCAHACAAWLAAGWRGYTVATAVLLLVAVSSQQSAVSLCMARPVICLSVISSCAWLGHLKSILGFAWEYIHSPRSQPMQTPEGWKWVFNS
jgi:hypothetical protein